MAANPTNGERPQSKTRTRQRQPRTTRHTFSTAQKIAAVTAMLTADRDHPTGIKAQEAAWRALGEDVHHSTLSDWFKLYSKEVLASLPIITTSQIVQETHDDIVKMYAEIERKGLAHAALDETIAKAPFDKAMLGVGIARTKIKEITSLPADEIAIVMELKRLLALRGYDMKSVMEQQIGKLKAEAATPRDDDTPTIAAGDDATDTPTADSDTPIVK